MSTCQDIEPLLARYVDRELDPAGVNRVDNHLSVCEACAGKAQLLEREAGLLGAALEVDDVPAHIGQGVWGRVREVRTRRMSYWWYAAAAAASILVALLIGVAARPARPVPQLARVSMCSGPLEVQGEGRPWEPLATHRMLREGDRIRCGIEGSGSVVFNRSHRLDLNCDTQLAFFSLGEYGRFRVEMARGHIHGRLTDLRHPLEVRTPVATVTVLAEGGGSPGRAEFQIRLSGIEPEVGLLGRLHLLPAAYAGPAGPRLEVIVHEGAVEIRVGHAPATEVESGKRVTVVAGRPAPEPEVFDAGSLREWWRLPGTQVARGADPLPVPEIPRPATRETGRAGTAPPGDEARPARPVEGPRTPVDLPPRRVEVKPAGPPPPAGLVAHPDIQSVVLTWKPVTGTRRPIGEYSVYRSAPDDTEFGLLERVPAAATRAGRYVFQDDGLRIGTRCRYAVAAAFHDEKGGIIEGEMSQAVTASPADLRVYYSGGDRAGASIVVEKLHDGGFRRQTFQVSKRIPGRAGTGAIGGPRPIVIEPRPGVRYRVPVDFSTGYWLVDIVQVVRHPNGIPKERLKIIIENGLGVRREILQGEAPGRP